MKKKKGIAAIARQEQIIGNKGGTDFLQSCNDTAISCKEVGVYPYEVKFYGERVFTLSNLIMVEIIIQREKLFPPGVTISEFQQYLFEDLQIKFGKRLARIIRRELQFDMPVRTANRFKSNLTTHVRQMQVVARIHDAKEMADYVTQNFPNLLSGEDFKTPKKSKK